MMTEEQIKAELDGTFTAWDSVRETWFTMPVPLDHLPDHKPKQRSKEKKTGTGGAYHWTPEEDDALIALRSAGNTFYSIAKSLNLAPKTVRSRYYKVCEERGIEPVSMEVSYPRLITREQERRIVQMRQQGMGFAAIGAVVGLTRVQANQAYVRWMKREGKRRLAA